MSHAQSAAGSLRNAALRSSEKYVVNSRRCGRSCSYPTRGQSTKAAQMPSGTPSGRGVCAHVSRRTSGAISSRSFGKSVRKRGIASGSSRRKAASCAAWPAPARSSAVSSGGRPCASASSSRASRRCVHASCACRSHRSCRSRCGSVGTAPRTAPPRGAVSSIGSQRSVGYTGLPSVSTTGPVSSGETKASQHRPSRRASSRRLPRPHVRAAMPDASVCTVAAGYHSQLFRTQKSTSAPAAGAPFSSVTRTVRRRTSA